MARACRQDAQLSIRSWYTIPHSLWQLSRFFLVNIPGKKKIKILLSGWTPTPNSCEYQVLLFLASHPFGFGVFFRYGFSAREPRTSQPPPSVCLPPTGHYAHNAWHDTVQLPHLCSGEENPWKENSFQEQVQVNKPSFSRQLPTDRCLPSTWFKGPL